MTMKRFDRVPNEDRMWYNKEPKDKLGVAVNFFIAAIVIVGFNLAFAIMLWLFL